MRAYEFIREYLNVPSHMSIKELPEFSVERTIELMEKFKEHKK